MPKVSVILPNYNHAKYLKSRIDSILNQTFTDFEIIILDDASIDNSLEIITQYKDPRIQQIIINKTNSGSTFIQWQKGLKNASGDYIWIAESDDVAHEDFLKILVSKLESNDQIGIAFSASNWINEDGETIHQPPHETEQLWKSEEIVKNEFLNGNVIYNASSAVFRQSKVSNIDFDSITKYKYAGDWLFWVQLSNKARVYRTSKRLNYFRRHENNVSTKSEKEGLHFKEGLRVIKYIFDHYNIPFLEKRIVKLKWAKKISKSDPVIQNQVLNHQSLEMIFYTKVLKLLY